MERKFVKQRGMALDYRWSQRQRKKEKMSEEKISDIFVISVASSKLIRDVTEVFHCAKLIDCEVYGIHFHSQQLWLYWMFQNPWTHGLHFNQWQGQGYSRHLTGSNPKPWETHKKIIENELEGFGIRLNAKPPKIKIRGPGFRDFGKVGNSFSCFRIHFRMWVRESTLFMALKRPQSLRKRWERK